MGKYVPPHLRRKKKTKTCTELEKNGPSSLPRTNFGKRPIKAPEVQKNSQAATMDTMFGILQVLYVDITQPQGAKVLRLMKDPLFSQAYLKSKRRLKKGYVEFYWITKADGSTEEIGAPEDWALHVAQKIRDRELSITVVRCGRMPIIKKKTRSDMQRYNSYKESNANFDAPLKRKSQQLQNRLTSKIQYCCRSEKGKRTYQEDRFVFLKDFQKLNPSYCPRNADEFPQQVFVGVYDGHGGFECAQRASEELHKCIARNMNSSSEDLDQPIMKGYLQFDNDFCNLARTSHDSSGSVACTVIIQERTLYVANIGDCATVLCRDGDAILLSDDHSMANCEEERLRVLEAGGDISVDLRLNGDLAVSRAFGDLIEDKTTGVFQKHRGLTAKPIIKKHYIQDEDEFIIVACDGIFDYIDYKNSVQTVRRNLRKYNDVERAADRLMQFAQNVPSMDNMTLVLVAFPKTDKDGKLVIVKSTYQSQGKSRRKFKWNTLDKAISDTGTPGT